MHTYTRTYTHRLIAMYTYTHYACLHMNKYAKFPMNTLEQKKKH